VRRLPAKARLRTEYCRIVAISYASLLVSIYSITVRVLRVGRDVRTARSYASLFVSTYSITVSIGRDVRTVYAMCTLWEACRSCDVHAHFFVSLKADLFLHMLI
jgi:hypothetical protein